MFPEDESVLGLKKYRQRFFVSYSKFSDSRDDAVKGVQKYDRMNLEKRGAAAFHFRVISQFRRPDYLEDWKTYGFFFHQVHP